VAGGFQEIGKENLYGASSVVIDWPICSNLLT
jgi:hypothetical protein